jgi:murein L,D-transpeptidase YafK
MRAVKIIAALAVLAILAGCGGKFRQYTGAEVTHIVVYKDVRKMFLMHNKKVLREYDFALGFAPEGDKKIVGDGKTPEGDYHISYLNPASRYHLSLKVSYPNANDIAEARALGKSAGGDIFIHGEGGVGRTGDWTWGCVAVTNREIEEIYSMVKVGTPISIFATRPKNRNRLF